MGLQLTDDELLLTLWTYRQIDSDKGFTASNPWVRWLSRVLKTLPVHSPSRRPAGEEFRSPEGLAKRVRQFHHIQTGRSRAPDSYVHTWTRYASSWQVLPEDAARVLDSVGMALPESGELISRLDEEVQHRRELWADLQSDVGYDGVSADQLKDCRIDRTQAGIYRDKQRTGSLVPDASGLTVSVLHTGQRYADDLQDDHLIYHYPDTGRSEAQDTGEIEATKNAARYAVPVFVQLPSTGEGSTRNVRLGFVASWDDDAKTFHICFAADEEVLYERVAAFRSGDGRSVVQTDLFSDTGTSSVAESSSRFREIPHVQNRSQLNPYADCRQVIYAKADETAALPPIHLRLDGNAGQDRADIQISIHRREEQSFRANWDERDPDRFPVPIRAAATALRDTGRVGRFRIWYDGDNLIILPHGHSETSPEEILDREVEGGDDSSQARAPRREGRQATYETTRYERNAQAREECLDHYGTECAACGMDFGERYGDIAKGFIHVHHRTPIADVDEEYEVDPIEDLRPVCPNCHAVIHRRSPPLSIVEVRDMLEHQ